MLKQSRLESLTDGIFAIVMTLLIIEINLKGLSFNANDHELIKFLWKIFPFFVSYILTFTILFVYWRAHHYITSFAKNINDTLSTLNGLFLLFVGLTPFSTHFLGIFTYSKIAIILYGINMILISLSLLIIRIYIRQSKNIINENISVDSEIRGMMRIITPLILFVGASIIAFFDTKIPI